MPIVIVGDWGQGGRSFYLHSAALAVLLAPAFSAWRTAVVIVPVLLLPTALHQMRIADSWQDASSQMQEFLVGLSVHSHCELSRLPFAKVAVALLPYAL